VPAALAALVMQLLAKRPADRPESAEEVVRVLQTLGSSDLEGAARIAGQKPLAARARGMLSRRRAAGLGIAALASAAVVGVLVERRVRSPGDAPRVERLMLAVLPFENLGRPEDEYFASGLAEEITSRLAGVQGLGVISRTSANQYKNTAKSLRQIGRELGVDYVLEGSVRWEGSGRAPGRIRVTPQLIRVNDDSHLWAGRYDARLADMFEVQATIAEQVARSLDIAIAGPARQALAARPTGNMEAYAYFLRGNDYLAGSWGETKRLRIALEMYGRAVELDPGFALAFAKLSLAHSSLYASTDEDTNENLRQAKAAAETALRLQPGLAEGHVALSYYHSRGRKAYDEALRELSIAERLQPNSGEVAEALGLLQRRRGRFREAVAHLKRAAALDPRSADLAADIGVMNWFLRVYPEAEEYLDRAMALSPDWVAPHAQKAWLYVSWRGDVDGARRVVEAAAPKVGLGNVVGFLNPDAMFFVPHEGPHGAAFLELAPRDFDNDTALYALCKAEWYRLRGASKLVRVYSDSARAVLEPELRGGQRLAWRRGFLGYAYAGLGRRTDAVREGLEAERMIPASTDPMQRAFLTFALARIYAVLGEEEAAIERLEYLMSVPSLVSAPLLRVDPTWEPLRGNARFQRLVEEGSSGRPVATPDSS
jgi:serine/threonine-protein kinase